MNPAPWHQLDFVGSKVIDGTHGRLHSVVSHPDRRPQVVFLHGVLRNWRSFYSIIPKLKKLDIPFQAIDFHGHGRSDHSRGRSGMSEYRVVDYLIDADDILRALDQPVIVYGHSLGAMVALGTAVKNPGQVRSIILEDPPFHTMGERLIGSPFEPYFRAVGEMLRARTWISSEECFEQFSNLIVGQSSDGSMIRVRDQRDETSRRFSAECLELVDANVMKSIQSGEWLEGWDWTDCMERLACKARILQADHRFGGMLVDEDANYIRIKLNDDHCVQTFTGAGHSLHWQCPDTIVDLIKTTIDEPNDHSDRR